jgi:hypothetical protein
MNTLEMSFSEAHNLANVNTGRYEVLSTVDKKLKTCLISLVPI